MPTDHQPSPPTGAAAPATTMPATSGATAPATTVPAVAVPRQQVDTEPPSTTATGVAGPPGTAPAVSVEDLRVSFPRGGRTIHALRGVSLDLRPGEILCLVGESGSGKSVLGLSMLGLLPASATASGRVVVAGHDMLTASARDRRLVRRDHLGAVFQDPMTSLNPTMRIGDQVVEAAGSQAEAVRLLRAAGIPDAQQRMRSFPHQLSGGLRQRVMIAMALAGGPAAVIADEPTTALDVTVQAQVLRLVRDLRDRTGSGFLFVTHDLGVAGQVADRIAVLYAGRLAEVGTARSVLRGATHPYTVGLIGARLRLRPDGRGVRTLRGEVPDPARPPAGCAFADRCDHVTPDCTSRPPELTSDAEGHARACVVPAATVRAAAAPPPDTLPAPVVAIEEGRGASPAAPAGPALTVTGVTKAFRTGGALLGARAARLTALRDVSLSVADGECVAVVGESGSGKSTLLRVAAGLERPDRGTVDRAGRGRPQMVFQDAGASLTPWLSVGALLAERLAPLRLDGAARRRRVEAALTDVGLAPALASARAGQLSGGQCQRVALARATIVAPRLLLCDEPTSALDASLAATVLNLIVRMRHEHGMAALFVTHDLAVAATVADRVAVMYLGRVVEIGAVDEVIQRPRHPCTQALVAAVPDLGAPLADLRGEPASPLRPPPGCAFHPRCPIALPECADPALVPPLVRPLRQPLGTLSACIHPEAR